MAYLSPVNRLTAIYTDRDTTVAFSGHRRIVAPVQSSLFHGAEIIDPEHFSNTVASKLDKALEGLVGEGYHTFLCGMAAGFDLMAGMAVRRLIRAGYPVDLLALVPHPGQAARFGERDREDYEKVLASASGIYTVCPEYRQDCFHLRNDLLVAHSSVLVCCYDGTPGGTRYTVKKALKAGHRVVNLL
ncbi:MAG: DUF1273 domain-containing protein [Alistipes sp.]|nr:DUF1273 domain-containing protein [Alistipes sp.]